MGWRFGSRNQDPAGGRGSASGLWGLISWRSLGLFSIGAALATLAWLSAGADAASAGVTSAAAEVTAGVLAIAATVVAIVLELATNRYTHRITQLFGREPINAATLGFFVVTTMACLWVSAMPASSAGAVSWLAMIMATVSLASLLPYFAFLFRFLEPTNTIRRIQDQAVDSIRSSKDDVSARPAIIRAIRVSGNRRFVGGVLEIRW